MKELSLYGLTHDVAALLESDNPSALDDLEKLLPVLQHKAAAVAGWIQYQEDMAAAIKEREKQVTQIRKAYEARAERSSHYLLECLERAEIGKITDSRNGVTIKVVSNPPHVVVDDESAIPREFWKQPEPPPPVIDKTSLKTALKAGAVPGAHLAQTRRIVIE